MIAAGRSSSATPDTGTPSGRRRLMRHPTRRVLAAATLAGLVGVPSMSTAPATGLTPPPRVADAAAPPPATPRYDACIAYSDFARWNPTAQVLRDTFTWRAYDPVQVGDGTGDIDWSSNPYAQVSWYMWLHSLRWLGAALDAAPKGDAAALTHAKAIARDWMRDNPYPWKANVGAHESTMHRTNILLCLRSRIVDQHAGALPATDAWLDTALIQHAEFMRHNFSGYANHGTDESLAMLGVGATLGRTVYVDLARERLTTALRQAIDAQGATNEQSTGYAYFNAYLWDRVAREVAKLLPGSTLSRAAATKRLALMTFIAHSFTPAGTQFQLGDTEAGHQTPYPGTDQAWPASGGRVGRPPAQRTASYPIAGFAFGRDTWGTSPETYAAANAYALRFGPRRVGHGHADHTALTWVADGQPVLIDPGYGEYSRDAWQAFAKSPQAHNQLVIGGMTDAAVTTMTRRAVTGDARIGIGDTYQLVDRPGAGFTRIRDVLIMSNPQVVVVVDRAAAPRRTTFTQLWHLPPKATVRVTPYAATAANNRSRQTTILPLPSGTTPALPRDAVRTVTGSSRPVQGWWWPSMFVKHPAPVVSVNQTGRSIALTTVITYARPSATVAATSKAGPARSTITTLRVGNQTVRFGRSAGGTLYRIR